MAKFAPFDAADYLDDEETIAEYITAALGDPNPDVFLTAVRDVARARGMAQRLGCRLGEIEEWSAITSLAPNPTAG